MIGYESNYASSAKTCIVTTQQRSEYYSSSDSSSDVYARSSDKNFRFFKYIFTYDHSDESLAVRSGIEQNSNTTMKHG